MYQELRTALLFGFNRLAYGHHAAISWLRKDDLTILDPHESSFGLARSLDRDTGEVKPVISF